MIKFLLAAGALGAELNTKAEFETALASGKGSFIKFLAPW